MKICHLSDSHLGAGENHPRRGSSGLTVRQEDIVTAFVEAVDRIISIRPDICVHSGDLFHAVRPLNRIMALAASQLHRLAVQNKIPTVVIAGNHDAPKQLHVGAALEVFEHFDHLYIAAAGKAELFKIGDCSLTALPHCVTESAFQEQLSRCHPDRDARHNILIMHGVAAGMPEFSMADLGEQELPLDVMERFSYTALGHYHNYCQVGPHAYYAGSTERLSQSEREAAKGFLEVDLEPPAVRFHEVRTRPMVDLKSVSAAGKRGDQLVQIIQEQLDKVDSSDKIVRLTVDGVSPDTFKTLPAQAVAELKQKAYALDIRFQRESEEEAAAPFDRPAIGQFDKSFIEYLETANLKDFDRQRLIREALKYLRSEE